MSRPTCRSVHQLHPPHSSLGVIARLPCVSGLPKSLDKNMSQSNNCSRNKKWAHCGSTAALKFKAKRSGYTTRRNVQKCCTCDLFCLQNFKATRLRIARLPHLSQNKLFIRILLSSFLTATFVYRFLLNFSIYLLGDANKEAASRGRRNTWQQLLALTLELYPRHHKGLIFQK